MTPKEYDRLVKKGLERPAVILSDEQREATRVDVPPRPVNQPHSAEYLPRKYIEGLEHNQKLNLCCRHVEENGHMAQWFATPTADKAPNGDTIPDILIIWCGECSRRHIRLLVGEGKRQVIKEVR